MYTESLLNDDDLVKKIRQIIKEELAWLKENQNQVRSIPENLVNIKRVIKELDVSKATIYNWLNKGVIQSKKIGGKVLFDLNAIINSLKTNEHSFGAGRDYSHAYTTPAFKAEHRYYTLKNKLEKGKSISKDDENFFIAFKEKYADRNGTILRQLLKDYQPPEID